MESRPNRFWPWCGIAIGSLYLLNPGAGGFEFIPDVIPVIGNLDEAAAVLLIVQSIQSLRRARK
jgi:uncharacterized membrane protein YkvA (DUF1232 family)